MSSRIPSIEWNNKNIVPVKPTVDKTLGKFTLDNVSGYARAGRILAFMGPSSSEKTTFINALSGRSLEW